MQIERFFSTRTMPGRLTLCLVIGLFGTSANAEPAFVTHQGRLLDAAGEPVNGPKALTFRLIDTDGEERYAQTSNVTLADGYYSVTLGGIEAATFAEGLSVTVEADGAMLSSQTLQGVPRAHAVDGAVRVSSSPVDCTDRPGQLRFELESGLQVCNGTEYEAIVDRSATLPGRVYLDTRSFSYPAYLFAITESGRTILQGTNQADRLVRHQRLGQNMPFLLGAASPPKTASLSRLLWVRDAETGSAHILNFRGDQQPFLFRENGDQEQPLVVEGGPVSSSTAGFDQHTDRLWVRDQDSFRTYALVGDTLEARSTIPVSGLPDNTADTMAFSADHILMFRTASCSPSCIGGYVLLDKTTGAIVESESATNTVYASRIFPFPGRPDVFALVSTQQSLNNNSSHYVMDFFQVP